MKCFYLLPILLCPVLASAQTHQPGQVKMQIPLGAQSKPQAKQPTELPQAGHPAGGVPLPGNNVPPAPVSQVFSSDAAMDTLLTEEVIRSLRDPFSPPAVISKKEAPKSDIELVELKDLRLNGVITGPRKVRAMLSSNTKTFFVAVGDKVGTRQGRITSIQPDLIKIVEYEVDDRGRKIPEVFEMRMTGEIVSLSRKDQ